MNTIMDNIRTILDFRSLEDNWDCYGAKPPSDFLIIEAIDLIRKIDRQPKMVAFTAADSIQFEWEKETGEYLEIDISEDCVSIFEMDSNKNVITERPLFANEVKAINYIVRCVLDKWYSQEQEEL